MPPSYLSGSTSSILPYFKWRVGYCILDHSLFMLYRHSSHWFESSVSLYLSVLLSHSLRYRLNVCGTLYQHRDLAPSGYWLGHRDVPRKGTRDPDWPPAGRGRGAARALRGKGLGVWELRGCGEMGSPLHPSQEDVSISHREMSATGDNSVPLLVMSALWDISISLSWVPASITWECQHQSPVDAFICNSLKSPSFTWQR